MKTDIKDLVLAIGQMQLDLEVVKEIPNEVLAFNEKEQLARNQHLTKIATIIDAVISHKPAIIWKVFKKLQKGWSNLFGAELELQFLQL